jgi:hypothetical protein
MALRVNRVSNWATARSSSWKFALISSEVVSTSCTTPSISSTDILIEDLYGGWYMVESRWTRQLVLTKLECQAALATEHQTRASSR